MWTVAGLAGSPVFVQWALQTNLIRPVNQFGGVCMVHLAGGPSRPARACCIPTAYSNLNRGAQIFLSVARVSPVAANRFEAPKGTLSRHSVHSPHRAPPASRRRLVSPPPWRRGRRQRDHGFEDRFAAANGAAGVPPSRARCRGGRRRGRPRGAAAAGLRLLPLWPRPRCFPHPWPQRWGLLLRCRRRPRALHPWQSVRLLPFLSISSSRWSIAAEMRTPKQQELKCYCSSNGCQTLSFKFPCSTSITS